jgi:hypothetical protein
MGEKTAALTVDIHGILREGSRVLVKVLSEHRHLRKLKRPDSFGNARLVAIVSMGVSNHVCVCND